MARTKRDSSAGKRRSSWLATRRCLSIIHRLLRRPASGDELIEAVRQMVGEDAYLSAPDRSLEYDLRKLRDRLGVTVPYDRADGVYRLEDLPFPLFDLSDEELTTLAFLYHNFPSGAPQGDEVRALLDKLVGLLPDERRRQVLRLRAIPDLDLEVLDGEEIDPDLWTPVERAVVERRQLGFLYRPAHREEGEPPERYHRVEPYGVDFRDGHYYLEAYCLQVRIGSQRRANRGTLNYRLSRIVPGTVQLLPDKLPPGRRPARTFTIRYRLGPAIARGGVTPRFPQTQVRRLEDGSAEVEAQTSNLWQARQTLLRYGQHCQVLAPPELVQMMRETVLEMAQIYGEEG